jgi:superfamily II DNA helicase RecQ
MDISGILTIFQDKDLWQRLEDGRYTHILLGPEQALHEKFLRLLRKAKFNQRIAFVGIDELHTIHQWKEFRTAYPDLYQLRDAIPTSIPWFGCTATLTREAEEFGYWRR